MTTRRPGLAVPREIKATTIAAARRLQAKVHQASAPVLLMENQFHLEGSAEIRGCSSR